MPDAEAVSITRAMVQCAEGLGEKDIALCLISGIAEILLIPLKLQSLSQTSISGSNIYRVNSSLFLHYLFLETKDMRSAL